MAEPAFHRRLMGSDISQTSNVIRQRILHPIAIAHSPKYGYLGPVRKFPWTLLRRSGRVARHQARHIQKASTYVRCRHQLACRAARDDASETQVQSNGPWRWEQSQNALQAYVAFFGLLSLGQIPALKSLKYVELPYFVGLACLTIYIGAHRGLTNKMRQQIGFKQGALAPLAASGALFGGFLLIKYLPWINLQTVSNAYFFLIGSAAVTGALLPPLRHAAGPLGDTNFQLRLPKGLFLDEQGESVQHIDAAPTDLLALLVGLAAASLDIASGHQNYTFNNLIACLICCDILQLIGLRSFRTAAVLLFGLLAYDVFWVFASPKVIGENVMLTVATSNILSGPTRLLFPRPMGSIGEAASFPFSLLGLGDIAVPGLLACLALRFDLFKMVSPSSTSQDGKAASSGQKGIGSSKDSIKGRTSDSSAESSENTPERLNASEEILRQRPYFLTTMVAYVGGLGMAFGVNAVTHLGQPALLYLVPCCLGGVLIIAATQGDLGRVINFTDVAPTVSLLPKANDEGDKD